MNKSRFFTPFRMTFPSNFAIATRFSERERKTYNELFPKTPGSMYLIHHFIFPTRQVPSGKD
jgi:hypothetical protein